MCELRFGDLVVRVIQSGHQACTDHRILLSSYQVLAHEGIDFDGRQPLSLISSEEEVRSGKVLYLEKQPGSSDFVVRKGNYDHFY